MTDLFPETMTVPVLSTAHLTRLDHDLLEAHIDIDRYTREDGAWTSDWKSPLIVHEDNNYGYWIYCGHEGLQADETGVAYVCDEMEAVGYSRALIEILVAGKEAGHSYIRFDCDGPTSEKFPTFEWSAIRPENVDRLEKQLRALAENQFRALAEIPAYGLATPKSTQLPAVVEASRRRQALTNGLILGLIPKIDANADEVLEAAGRVGMPWTYKDIPRLFVLANKANKADLIKDTEFFYFDPDTNTFIEEKASHE